jgi:importin subunit beta-1
VTKAAIGVLGDLADTLKGSVAPLFQQRTFWREFADECLQNEDYRIKETAQWASNVITQLVSS